MANTLKFGNGLWATKEGATLAYNDENDNYKPLPFDFARASNATVVNKDGLIEVVGKDIPRIDFADSEDGVLLLEPSSTNLITYSSNLSVLSKVSVGNASAPVTTANYALAPDGTMTATRVVFDLNGGTSNQDRSILRQAIPLGNYYFSIYVKSTNGTEQKVMWHDGGEYNTTTVTNEWVRITYDARPTSTFGGIALNPTSGVDTSDILAWGFQVEALSHPTSYIPTSGSSVTRVAETCNNAGNSEVFNDSEGVLFADFLPITFTDVAPNYYKTITVSDNSTSNRVFIGITSASKLSIGLGVGGTNTFFTETPIAELNVKVALKYTANLITAYFNGFKLQTPISGSFNFASGALKSLNLNQGNGGYPFYGKTKEIGYYDTALTDEELEYLTSYRSLNEMVTELNLNEL